MTEQRPKRGLSLSVQLIAGTAVLLAVAVGASALFSYKTITDLAGREMKVRRESGEASMRRQSELLARNAAASASLPLAEGNFTYLDSIVATTAKEDARIQWLLVSDAVSNRIVARTPAAPKDVLLKDALSAQVAAAPANRAVFVQDPAVPTLFTCGIKIQAGERVVGQLRMAISTADLEADLARAIAATKARAASSATQVALIAGLILLIGSLLVGAYQSLRITGPLKGLAEQAARIAGGELDRRVPVHSRDEIGRLAADFNDMAERLGTLLVETANKASLEREMSLARSIQEAMSPPPRMIEHGPVRVIGYCEPATTCGGDWWTVRRLGGGRVLVCVGDVTGHGIPSAMIAATARGAVEALVRLDIRISPEQVLRAIDGAIRDVRGEQQLLMTCFAALIDVDRGVMEFSNAGHNFPYVVHMDPKTRALTGISVLALRGSPLGGDDLPTLESGQRALQAGDVFVGFTDGVIDRVDRAGNRFGDRRLRALLGKRTLDGDGVGLSALRDDILARMRAFADGTPADDDMTLVLCQYEPRGEAQIGGVRVA
jgi:phosphoserine phosphatase RsbU/P